MIAACSRVCLLNEYRACTAFTIGRTPKKSSWLVGNRRALTSLQLSAFLNGHGVS
jgi:hypothetical protein